METLDQVLAHFGIRGMKWGVRRPVGSSGRVEGGSSHPSSSDAERAKLYQEKLRTQGMHTLSNQELQHLVSRTNLEKQYSTLTTPKTNTGARIAKEIVVQVGKQQASALLAKGASELTKKALAGK